MADIFEDDFIDFSYSTVGGAITANITPFSHNVVTNTSNDGSTINYTYTFAQAYIVTNSPFDSRASGVISGMGDAFTIPVDEDIEFQVKVTLSKQNYKVLGTEFFTGLPSEEGQNTGNFTYPVFDYISEDTGGNFQFIYPVCSVRNQHVVNQTARDNIVIDKVQFKQLGGTGASVNGEGGVAHIIQESGRENPNLPIRLRAISGGSGIQVRYESADPTGDFYHSGDGGLIIIDSSDGGSVSNFVANTGDSVTGAKVYKEGTNSPQYLRSLTGAKPPASAQFSEIYVHELDNEIVLSGELTGLWTGENVGVGSQVYKAGTGPSASPPSKAQFRKIIGEVVDDSNYTEGEQKATVTVGVGTQDDIEIGVDLSTVSAVGVASEPYPEGGSLPSGTVLVGGARNSTSGYFNSITAGANNTISGGELNFVGGGSGNDVNFSRFSSSLGGKNNDISGANYSVLLGGDQNLIKTGHAHFLGGGVQNKISGSASIISNALVGGTENKILDATYSFIGAGATNTVYSNNSVIGGGTQNIASGDSSVVFGGSNNQVLADYGVAAGRYSTVQANHDGAFVLSDSNTSETLSSGANTLTLNFKSGVYVTSDSGLYINGNAVLTGETPEGDTLQTVTDRGATTTNALTIDTASDISFIVGSTDSTARIQLNDDDTTGYLSINSTSLALGHTTTLGDQTLHLTSAGKVGIGTNAPAYALTVNAGTTNQIARFISSDPDAVIGIQDNTDAVFIGHDAALDVMSLGFDSSMGVSTNVNITTGGHVGIGTNAPSEKLHVYGGDVRISDGTPVLTLHDTSSSALTTLTLDGVNTTLNNAGTNGSLIFSTESAEAMRINEDGNVGIGTNAPSGNLHIQANSVAGYVSDTYADLITESNDSRIQVVSDNGGSNGSALILTNVDAGTHSNWAFGQTTTAQGNKLHIGHNTAAGGDVSAYTTTQDLVIDTGGNVGLGTFSPQKAAHLYVDGNDGLRIQSSNNHAFTQIMANDSYSAYIQFRDSANRYWIQSTTDDKLRFRPNATSLESATINFDATGNVGIGVLSPSQKLEVGTNTDVSAQIGRAHVGYVGFGDYAGFAHLDKASTSAYALIQGSLGDTHLNAANGQNLFFRQNHVAVGGFNTSSDFYVDTDTLYVDVSADSVGINDTTPSHALDVNGIIRTQGDNKGGGLLGTQFTNIPCTTIDGFFASTSTEDYGYQNALVLNDLAGFTKWAGVTIATSGLYKTRGGSAGSYTYSNEAGTGDFERAFQANNNTLGSWYTDSGPDGDITTGAANSGSVELYFNGVKSLNYSAQAAVIFGSNPFRATHVKIEALRTGGWQTIVDTTGNDKTAIIARIGSNGGGSNATTGLRYTFAKAGSYFRINNFYAADYDLGNDTSYGGQYYIDKYYDGRHYSTLRPVIDGGSDLGTSSYRYGGSYVDYGRFTNAVGIGTDTLTYGLNVSNSDEILAHFKSSDNKAGILIQDNDTAAYVSVENNILSLGPQNGTNATQNLNYNVTNYRLGIGTNVPSTTLHVEGTGTFHSVDITGASTLTVSGNVGIGTTNPSDILEVVPSDTYGGITVKGNVVPRVVFNSTNGGGNHWGVGVHDNNGNAFAIGHNGAGHAAMDDYVVVKSGGNVGIGSASPARKLDVSTNGADTYGIRNSYGASHYMEMAHNRFNAVGNNYIRFNIDDATKMTIVDSDFGGGVNGVGIGITNPAFELDVEGTIHGTSGNFENGITIDGNPVVTGSSSSESDTLQTVTDEGNTTTNNIIINNAGSDPDYGALTITGGYALAHLRSTGTVAYLQFQNSTTSYGTVSSNGMTIGNNGHDAYVTNRQALGNLYLGTSGEARVAIKPDGKVGIGTLTPDAHLNVYNTGTSSSAADVHIVGSGNTYGLLYERLRNDSLIVSKSTTAGSYFKTDSATASYQGYEIGTNWFIGQYGYNDLRILDGSKSAGTAAITIKDSTQNVGIGTTNPAAFLEVSKDNSNAGNQFVVADTEGATAGIRTYTVSDPQGIILNHYYAEAGSSNEYARYADIVSNISNGAGSKMRFITKDAANTYFTSIIDNSGRFGIGTDDPETKLHVQFSGTNGLRLRSTDDDCYMYLSNSTANRNNIIYFGDNSSNFAGMIQYNHQYDYMAFRVNGGEKVRIAAAGNVGIGTAAPSEKLHVLGTTRLGGRGYTGGANIEYASFSETNGGASTIVGNAVYAGNANNTYRKTRSDAGNFISLNYNKGITFHTNVTGSASSTEYDINNHEQMRITTGGFLGIGVTTPESKLHVAGGDIRVDNAKSILGETNGGGNFQMIKIDTSDNMLIGDGNLVIDINGTSERMKINSAGNVLIGQPTDTVDKLMVQGAANLYAARFNGSSNGGQSYGVRIRAGSNSVDQGLLVENTAGADLFIVKGDGNVSVGATHVADTRFFVTGAVSDSLAKFKDGDDGVEFTTRGASRQQIDFLGSNTSAINAKGSLYINYDSDNGGSNDSIQFTRNGIDEAGTLDMIIKEGNVGIGTDAPQKNLDIQGQFMVRPTSNTTVGRVLIGSTASDAYLELKDASSNNKVFLNTDGDSYLNGGDVGIGTASPAYDLHVHKANTTGPTIELSNSEYRAYINSWGSTASAGRTNRFEINAGATNFAIGADTIRFQIGDIGDSNEKVRIDGSGFVGIGTSSPSYELDVVGTTRSTYYIGGAYLEENASSSKLKFYKDGTVLVIDEDGELKPCDKENDTLVFGVSKIDFDSPVVLGAEPILITGPIKVGDYIVTSSKQGHGQAMKEQKLGTIIAQAMENGDGESYNIKAMIRKM